MKRALLDILQEVPAFRAAHAEPSREMGQRSEKGAAREAAASSSEKGRLQTDRQQGEEGGEVANVGVPPTFSPLHTKLISTNLRFVQNIQGGVPELTGGRLSRKKGRPRRTTRD